MFPYFLFEVFIPFNQSLTPLNDVGQKKSQLMSHNRRQLIPTFHEDEWSIVSLQQAKRGGKIRRAVACNVSERKWISWNVTTGVNNVVFDDGHGTEFTCLVYSVAFCVYSSWTQCEITLKQSAAVL